MTKVSFELNGERYRFEADGHAEDQVLCGKISILAQALVDSLIEYLNGIEEGDKYMNSYREESGYMELAIDRRGLERTKDKEILLAFGVVLEGFKILKDQYEDKIELEVN